jgi:hypothetical protein
MDALLPTTQVSLFHTLYHIQIKTTIILSDHLQTIVPISDYKIAVHIILIFLTKLAEDPNTLA